MLNWKIVGWSLGSWAAVSFVVCVLWGLVTPQELHMHETACNEGRSWIRNNKSPSGTCCSP